MDHLLEWDEFKNELNKKVEEKSSELSSMVNSRNIIEHALKPFYKEVKGVKGVKDVSSMLDYETPYFIGFTFEFKDTEFVVYYSYDDERIYLKHGKEIEELEKRSDVQKLLK